MADLGGTAVGTDEPAQGVPTSDGPGLASVAVRGAAAGAVATVAMSGIMMAAQRSGLMGRHPPSEIVRAATGRKVRGKPRSALAIATHLGFGAASGAAYAIATRPGRGPDPAPATGVIFGLGVWAVSYKGWVPALGILPPPRHDRPGRPAAMIAAHLVYGATLGGLVRERGGRELGT